jgi:hypothetical protein
MSVTQAAALSTSLCVPVFFAVCAASLSRPFARLSASAPSVGFVAVGAATLAAVTVASQLSLLPERSFLIIAPPWIGAAPWAGGEMVSGPSRRQDESFAASVVAAYAAGVLALCVCPHLLCQTLAAGFAATLAYLCVRGGLRDAGEPDADRDRLLG